VADVNAEFRRQEMNGAGFDPAPHVSAISNATTGRDILAAIPAGHEQHPEIRAAVVDALSLVVKGAQSVSALDAMSKHFSQVWGDVQDEADARRAELQQGEAA
jgi:hypothetical protein